MSASLVLGLVGCSQLPEHALVEPYKNGSQCITTLVNAPVESYDADFQFSKGYVDLRSDLGQQRLSEVGDYSDYPNLAAAFLTQATQTFCGVASSTMVLNAEPGTRAMRPVTQPFEPFPFYTQCNVLNPEVEKGIDVSKVLTEGLELTEIHYLLSHQAVVEEVVCLHATDKTGERTGSPSQSPDACGVTQTFADYKEAIKWALKTDYQYAIANFAGAPVASRGGHFSPVAAYHEASDSFLIMDVSRYKYPPFWAPAEDLWQGMQMIDPGSGLSRGYIIVTTKQPETP